MKNISVHTENGELGTYDMPTKLEWADNIVDWKMVAYGKNAPYFIFYI